MRLFAGLRPPASGHLPFRAASDTVALCGKGARNMGIIYLDLRLSNFAHSDVQEIDAKSLVDTGAIDLIIPEHLAIQLKLKDLKPREVILATGNRQVVRYVGPVNGETLGRDCATAAAVTGDQVLLGAIPMEAMDLVIHPRTQQVAVNPESPNIPMFSAK